MAADTPQWDGRIPAGEAIVATAERVCELLPEAVNAWAMRGDACMRMLV